MSSVVLLLLSWWTTEGIREELLLLLLLVLREGLGMVGRLVVADGKSWRPRSVLVGMRLLLVLRKDLGRRTLTVEMSLGMHGDLLMLEMELLLLDLLLLELLLLNLLLLLDLLLLLLLLLLEVVMMVMNSDGSRSHHPWRRLVEGTESLRLSQATELEMDEKRGRTERTMFSELISSLSDKTEGEKEAREGKKEESDSLRATPNPPLVQSVPTPSTQV